MHFTKKTRELLLGIKKYWQNRTFRKNTLKEKRRLYLTPRKESESAFFSLLLKKKRFYYFNTLVNILEANRDRFRLSFLLIGSTLIFLSTYILFFSPYFRISPSKVIIERTDAITDINIAYKAIEGTYGESTFWVNRADVQSQIVSLQKNIKHVEVSRLFPNGLKIIVESHKPQFITHVAGVDKNYVITSNGILVYQKEADAKMLTLDLVDPTLSEAGFLDYKEGVRTDFMKSILTARDIFHTTFPNVNISKFAYFRWERELHIFLESGTKVLIRLGGDIEKQIALLKFYNDNNKDIINSGNIQYIDTRIIGKFFVCTDKNLCKKNLFRIYGDYYK